MTLRIGAVSYLNTKPLIYGLQARLPDSKLVLDLPSRLADRLADGELDVALIPSVEFLRSRELVIVSDACIACHGPVRSVRLLLRKPAAEIRSLALDEGSRTSAALAQVLLAEAHGVRPELRPLPIDADYSRVDADAVLIIGDRAMEVDLSAYAQVWDLGEHWNHINHLPFVFAMWVTTRPFASTPLATALQDCRDQGLRNLSEIVASEAAQYDLTDDDCRNYFENQLYFHLGQRELAGLELFRAHASQLGLVPESSHQLSLQPT